MAKRASHLRHAVTPPSLTQAQVPRPRLIKILEAHLDKKLILIAAPAGYGKTTLLAEFGGKAGLPVAWVRLSEADQDAMRLAELVWSSLVKRFRRLRGALNMERLAEASAEGLARAISSALGERVSDRLILIIDDVHLLNDSETAHEVLRSLVDQLPPNVCVVMAGREVPDIPLVKLIARDEMATLSQDDLALDRGELEAVIEQRLGMLPEEGVVTRIANETEGWLTGVILSEVLLQSKAAMLPGEAVPPTYQYLASAAFDSQPEEIRRFMLGSAVFPVMTAAGCDAVLARNDSQRMLNRLATKGLFTSVTGTRPKTYEYHHQFHEFLLKRGEVDLGAELNELRGKAAVWLEEAGEIEEAVDLFLGAERVEEAARAAKKVAMLLVASGRAQPLARWVSVFRRRRMHIAELYWAYGAVLGDRGYGIEALTWLQLARKHVAPRKDAEIYPRMLWTFVHEALKLRRIRSASLAVNELRNTLEASDSENHLITLVQIEARLVWETTGDAGAALRIIEREFTDEMLLKSKLTGILQDCALYLGLQGSLDRAELFAREGVRRARTDGSTVTESIALNNLAYCLFLKGEFETAIETASGAREVSRQLASPRAIMYAETTLGELLLDLGMLSPAANVLGAAEAYARRIEDEDNLSYVIVRKAQLEIRRGKYDEADILLEKCSEMDLPPYDNELVLVNQLLLLCRTDPDQARVRILDTIRSGVCLGENRTRCFLGLALVARARNQERRSAYWLGVAISYACRNGFAEVLAAEFSWQRELTSIAKRFHVDQKGLAQVEDLIRAMDRSAYMLGVKMAKGAHLTAPRLEAFGLGAVKRDGLEISGLLPLHREILFWLIDRGSVHMDTLRETYWPGLPASAQAANLHTAIYNIRKFFGKEFVAMDSGGYRIRLSPRWSYDVRDFLQALEVATRVPDNDPRELSVLSEAISLYTGEFLQGCHAGWAVARRAELGNAFVGLALRYARVCARLHQSRLALEVIRKALGIDPYHDGLNRVYLEALGRAGRRYELVRHYRRYVKLLAEDLGLDVPPRTAAAYERLIA